MKLAGLDKGLWWSRESIRVVNPIDCKRELRNDSAGELLGGRHWVRVISELKQSHRCSHSVHSIIDLIFVGIQAFGSIQVLTDGLSHLLHVL